MTTTAATKVTVMAFCPAVDIRLIRFLKAQKVRIFNVMWVLAPSLVRECCPEHEPLEAIDPEAVVPSIEHYQLFKEVGVADKRTIRTLKGPTGQIIMPDTEISRCIARRLLQRYDVKFMPY